MRKINNSVPFAKSLFTFFTEYARSKLCIHRKTSRGKFAGEVAGDSSIFSRFKTYCINSKSNQELVLVVEVHSSKKREIEKKSKTATFFLPLSVVLREF